jgi:hypothetical protein
MFIVPNRSNTSYTTKGLKESPFKKGGTEQEKRKEENSTGH